MKTTNKTMWLSILEVMYEGDKTKESNEFEAALIGFFEMRRLQGDKIQIIKTSDNDRTQLRGVYGVDEAKEIERHVSLSAFINHVSDMIGFEIAERSQCSDNATLVNESGFKLSVRHALLVEA